MTTDPAMTCAQRSHDRRHRRPRFLHRRRPGRAGRDGRRGGLRSVGQPDGRRVARAASQPAVHRLHGTDPHHGADGGLSAVVHSAGPTGLRSRQLAKGAGARSLVRIRHPGLRLLLERRVRRPAVDRHRHHGHRHLGGHRDRARLTVRLLRRHDRLDLLSAHRHLLRHPVHPRCHRPAQHLPRPQSSGRSAPPSLSSAGWCCHD